MLVRTELQSSLIKQKVLSVWIIFFRDDFTQQDSLPHPIFRAVLEDIFDHTGSISPIAGFHV